MNILKKCFSNDRETMSHNVKKLPKQFYIQIEVVNL